MIIVTMPEGKTSRLIERGKVEMEDIYEFHERENPGRLFNHIDFLLAVTAGKINRYLFMPLVGLQTFRDGIGDHLKETVMV